MKKISLIPPSGVLTYVVDNDYQYSLYCSYMSSKTKEDYNLLNFH